MTARELAHLAVVEHHALQKTAELAGLLALLERDPPRVVLEIGAGYGGTLWAWGQVLAPGGRRICIDLQETPDQDLDGVELLIGTSHDWHVRGHLEVLLAGEMLDFAFIDGDHIHEGVAQDWKMYSPLVRPGGLVAFHDTAAGDPQVAAFWNELTPEHDTLQIYDNHADAHGGGIGVVFV